MLRETKRTRVRRSAIAVLGGAICGAMLLTGAGAGAAPPATGSADLAVTKSDSPDPVKAGGVLTYAIRVTNAGPDAAPGVVLTDKLPNSVDLISATSSKGGCKAKGNKVTCSIGSLTADPTDPYVAASSANVTLKVRAPAKAGTISNTVSVKSDAADPNPANDSDTETTRVVAGAAVPSCAGVEATIVGTSNGESLQGTSGRDVIVARGGADEVLSSGGRDLICAGAGADRVKAGAGRDVVLGAGGRDRLGGQGGADVVRGQGKGDRLRGGSGDDLLAGGRGNDRCNGGSGTDKVRSCES